MSLNRKRKKELRKLQSQANNLWESQQVLVGEAANIAREAGRQLGNFGREQVVPGVKGSYGRYAAPYVDKSKQFSKQVLSDKVVPTAGAVVGSALSVWDAANDTRSRLASGKGFVLPDAATYAKKADKYGAQAVQEARRQAGRARPAEAGHRRRWRDRDRARGRRRGRRAVRRMADAAG